jgi:uncharacterized protein (UPF0335 family)
MVSAPPLNTDLRIWAMEEIKRLEAENAALKEELNDTPPGGWKPPPAIPEMQELRDQVRRLEEENKMLKESRGSISES